MLTSPKVVVVMPAYDAGRTLRMTYEELPKDCVNLVIVVDDGSTDATLDVARQIGLEMALENRVFGLSLSEFHTGYRAFRREALECVNFAANSDGFIFDQEIVAQIVAAGFRIAEIAVPTRYFPEASSAGFTASTAYGLRILAVLFWYTLHRYGLHRSCRFDSLRLRYTRLP